MSAYKPLAIRAVTARPLPRWALYPPSPGGWHPPQYLAWVPMPLRAGWLHRRFRCYKPGCRRSWTYDGTCARHYGWDAQ